jgi:membrane protease subunit HflC
MRIIWCVLGVVLALAVLSQCYFTVDPTEFVYVTQFGAPVAVYDGGAHDSDAGLHWRWPWPVQSLQRLDRRLQYFDLPAAELLTKDAEGKIDKTLTVKAYVCWRIVGKDADEGGVDRFIRRMGSARQAEATLGKRLNGELGAVIGQKRMDDLISTDSARVDKNLEDLRQLLLDSLQSSARTEYGIELVDIRLRRFNHPAQVREAIFERIRTDRNKLSEQYRTDGKLKADNIRSEAVKQVSDLLAEAKSKAKTLKGEAEVQADQLRNLANLQDPEFYVFLKDLEKMQGILTENRTMLLLSTRHPIFRALFAPPRLTPNPAVPQQPPAAPQKKEGGS